MLVGQAQRHQLLVAVQQLGHAALGDVHAVLAQRLVHLRHAALLAAAPVPDLGDDVQAELALRQRPGARFLWPIPLVIPWAADRPTPSHPQDEPPPPIQAHHRPPVGIGYSHELAAPQTRLSLRRERHLPLCRRPSRLPSHPLPIPCLGGGSSVVRAALPSLCFLVKRILPP